MRRVLLPLLLLLSAGSCERVLFACIGVYDHVLPMSSLALEVAARARDVTVITSRVAGSAEAVDALRSSTLRRAKGLPGKLRWQVLGGSADPAAAPPPYPGGDVFPSLRAHFSFFSEAQGPLFSAARAALAAERFSFAVVDRFTFGAMHACELLGVRFLLTSAQPLMDMDGPAPNVPAPFYGFGGRRAEDATAWDRVAFLYYRLRLRLEEALLLRNLNAFRREKGAPPLSSLRDLSRGRIALVATSLGLEVPRRLPPTVRLVGPLGLAPAPDPPQPPPAALSDWMAADARPILAVSLGEAGLRALSGAQADALGAAAAEAGLRALWLGVPAERRGEEGPEVKFAPFLRFEQEAALLAHPAVRAVATTGALHAVHAALRAGKPLLCLPTTPFEAEGAHRLAGQGAGRVLPLDQLDPGDRGPGVPPGARSNGTCAGAGGSVPGGVLRGLLAEGTYEEAREIAQRISFVLEREGRSAASRAADALLEAERLGVEDLLPVADALPPHRRWLLDVYAIYGAVLCGLVVIVRTLWTLLWTAGAWTLNLVDDVLKPPPARPGQRAPPHAGGGSAPLPSAAPEGAT